MSDEYSDEFTIQFYGDVDAFGLERRRLSFCPGSLADYSIFNDVKVFALLLYGKVDDPEDEREAWADPIRVEVLRRLRHKDWNWYITADGWYGDPDQPNKRIPLIQHLKNLFVQPNVLKIAEVTSHRNKTRTFIEIPYQMIGDLVSILWSHAYPSYWDTLEGYQLPPGSLDLLQKWGERPLDEKLFRQVVDDCSLLFYTIPVENRHLHFLTNKWTLEDMEKMLDLPSLQVMANQIKAQLGK